MGNGALREHAGSTQSQWVRGQSRSVPDPNEAQWQIKTSHLVHRILAGINMA